MELGSQGMILGAINEWTGGAFVMFWGSALLLAYTFAGYPVLARVLAAGKRGAHLSAERPENVLLTVSVVLVVRNEETRIVERLRNLAASLEAIDSSEILVISDGSTDETVARVEAEGIADLRVLAVADHRGKSVCLNLGVAEARGEIVVFADARQRFAGDAVARLVEHFADDKVGAVSGSLEIERSAESAGEALGAYWSFEKKLRHWESMSDSSIGCTGAIYAIRRALFREIPEDIWLDDVVIPMLIAREGKRVLFDPAAVAYDPQPLGGAREERRKRRTLGGNYQMLFRYPSWLFPWGHRLWWRLISHKYLRLAAPVLLVLLLVASVALALHPFYRFALAGQLLFYGAALLGLLLSGVRTPLLAWPAGFVFLNWMAVRGLAYFVKHRGEGAW